MTAQAATFTVDDFGDSVDAIPGNGVCANGAGACSLRAAIQEANAFAGADKINLPGAVLLDIPGAGEDLAALLHGSDWVGRSPSPTISPPDRDRGRSANLEHPVQHVAGDQRLGFLRPWMTSTKPISDDRLVPKEGVLDRALAVIARLLPASPTSDVPHSPNRTITGD